MCFQKQLVRISSSDKFLEDRLATAVSIVSTQFSLLDPILRTALPLTRSITNRLFHKSRTIVSVCVENAATFDVTQIDTPIYTTFQYYSAADFRPKQLFCS